MHSRGPFLLIDQHLLKYHKKFTDDSQKKTTTVEGQKARALHGNFSDEQCTLLLMSIFFKDISCNHQTLNFARSLVDFSDSSVTIIALNWHI